MDGLSYTAAMATGTSYSANKFGYNGHENQIELSLGWIDYGFRQLDPVLGCWHGADKLAEKHPAESPYSYCGNDPINRVDPDGLSWKSFWKGVGNIAENIITFHNDVTVFSTGLAYHTLLGIDGTIGYIDGYFSKSGNSNDRFYYGSMEASHLFDNSIKIVSGQFRSDKNLNWRQRTWQVISRHTWEGGQNAIGLHFAIISNTFGRVDEVDNYGGATTITHHNEIGGAFTIGSYIQGGPLLRADPNESYFQHEYGHYLQSRFVGPIYLGRYALPSLMSARKGGDWIHDNFEVEQDANIRALDYWNQTIDGYSGWKPNNPINSDSNRIYPDWYDYLFPIASSFLFHKP
jgi:RHS repeat-associated protein